MSRFKDFGVPFLVNLSKDKIKVLTTTPEDSKVIRTLEKENKEFLDPWKIPMNTDSSETKIFTVKYENTVVGQVILWNFQVHEVKSCSISYWIVEEFINKGITTSAVELACEYAFTELSVDEIDATIQPENVPSIRVIEKNKFPHRKTIGEHKIFQGRWQSYTVYTISKEPRDNLSV